jgi:hypothetical protein
MTESGTTPSISAALDHHAPDHLLQVLVSTAQSLGHWGLGITLVVDGGIVSGDLVGRDSWFETLHTNHHDRLGDMTEVLRDAMKRADADHSEQDDDDLDNFGYIHLVNARYVGGGTFIPTTGGMLWRGRLTSISGFNFGTVG